MRTGVPEGIRFETKPAIALGEIRWAIEEGIPLAPVVAEAGYGNEAWFREALTALDLPYVLGVNRATTVWRPGEGPLPPKPWSGRGQPPKRLRRDRNHQPVSVLSLAQGLPEKAWKNVAWREGVKRRLRSRFAALRVRPAHRDEKRTEPRPEEWLLIEWPKGEAEAVKYWLATLPAETKLRDLVRLAKHRWIIERDYEELKQELGLGHFEGRGWRGFHHHATLCIAAYGFLVAERSRFSPPPAPVDWNYPSPKPCRISGRGVLPVRTARHHPWAIATLHMTVAQVLLRRLKGCPYCRTPLL